MAFVQDFRQNALWKEENSLYAIWIRGLAGAKCILSKACGLGLGQKANKT
jgi:hypothetical protein